MVQNCSLPKGERLHEVYLDESCIHHHCQMETIREFVWSSRHARVWQKDKHKGKQHCIVCTSQGPSVDPKGLPGNSGGIIPHSWWDFCPTHKWDHKGDCHKVSNWRNFTEWFKNQLMNEPDYPSLIVMDKAKHHCMHDDSVPKIVKMRKVEFCSFLMEKHVWHKEDDTVANLKKKAKQHIIDNEPWQTVQATEERGHKILWTPPGHSDLQPIKLVWAQAMGNVCRQCNKNKKISNTHEQLMEQAEPFDTEEGLTHTQKVTEKCHHTLLIIWNEVTKDKNDIDIEAVVEESKNDEAEGSSSNSDASSPSSPESSEASEDSTVGVWQHQMLPFLLRRPPWLMCWIVRSGENSIQVLKTTQWFSLTCKSCNCNLHLSCLITLSKKEFPLFLAAWMCSSYSKWQASDGFGVVFTCGTLSIPLSICSQLFHMWSILNTHTQIVMVWGQVARFQWLMMNWQFVKQQVKTLMTHSFCEIVGARFKGNCQSRGIQDSGFVNECGWNGWDDGIYMVPWFEEARRHALYVTW